MIFLNEDFYYSLLEEINNIPLALNKGDTNTIRYNNKLFFKLFRGKDKDLPLVFKQNSR